MNKVLLLTKNDFEGMASAILIKYIHGDNIDIKFFNYSAPASQYSNLVSDYDIVIAVGLKNSMSLTMIDIPCLLLCKNFNELYNEYKDLYPEDYTNHTLQVFYDNALSYIDWSWANKHYYYGKNIDELSKYIGKQEMINKIANRIACNEELVTKTEKEMLVFAKKIMTNNIQNKRYEIKKTKNRTFAVTYAEMYEIELANYILSQEPEVDAVVIFNMTTKIARVKTARNVNLEKEITALGGITNSNGGTIKFGNAFDSNIFGSILHRL